MTAIHVIGEYTDANAVAAIAAEDVYIKNIGDTILGNLDFNSNQAVNMLLEVLANAPSGAEGRIYFDNSTKKVYIYRGI